MSRVGNRKIFVPKSVRVVCGQDTISVSGPKGEVLVHKIPEVDVVVKDGEVVCVVDPEESKKNKHVRSKHGTQRSLISNAVHGVVKEWSGTAVMHGVGYKADRVDDNTIAIRCGYTHKVIYSIPKTVAFKIDMNKIHVSGVDKQQVGRVVGEIVSIRKMEPYKGTGISRLGDFIYTKVGKKK